MHHIEYEGLGCPVVDQDIRKSVNNECQLWVYNGNQGGVVSEIIHRIIHDDLNIFLSEDHT